MSKKFSIDLGIGLGADSALSRAIDAYAKLQVGLRGTFGVGLGLKFGF